MPYDIHENIQEEREDSNEPWRTTPQVDRRKAEGQIKEEKRIEDTMLVPMSGVRNDSEESMVKFSQSTKRIMPNISNEV